MTDPKSHSLTATVDLTVPASAATASRVVQAQFDRDPGGDGEIVRQIGRATLAWNHVDNVLRVVLKRLGDQSFELGTADYVYEIESHGELCKHILNSLGGSRLEAPARMQLEQLIHAIGAKRKEGLYGKRNAIFHRAWLVTEAGKAVSARLGVGERFAATEGSVDLTPEAIGAVAVELVAAANAALEITESLIT